MPSARHTWMDSLSELHTDLPVPQDEPGRATHRKPGPGACSHRSTTVFQPTSEKSGSFLHGFQRLLTPSFTFYMYIGFLLLNAKTRCLLNFVPRRTLCVDVFLVDNWEGESRGHSRVLAVDLIRDKSLPATSASPSPPLLPSPYSGKRGFAFQPRLRLHMYTADKIFRFTPSPCGTHCLTGKRFV